ncbi:hypothetical protein [Paenibacillus mendelii]|uniref:DUF5590 domain-containing protein n=1 Tax=Paenibacillus mendelii TaxID=206163 RepID=A0ABV6JDD6_9BACL|nr:hypothetical protein [Paenibacillus mendelii]MCQ6563763.1 hypothetical protein [Paenibacillus mendelii]
MKKNRIFYICAAAILTAIFVLSFSDRTRPTYGDDRESIEKVIQSIDGYENESIQILEMKDIDDVRVVGFLANNNPAYIQFTKNKEGHYEWRHAERSNGQSFATYLIHVSKEESAAAKFMIVTNQENDIASMELGVNEQVIEQEFPVNQNSVTLMDLPESNDGSYRFHYKYYDAGGTLIGEPGSG